MSNISFEINDQLSWITLDIINNDKPIATNFNTEASSFSVAVISSKPLSVELISGGIKGDKGATGDVEDYDPGDLTLIFDNKLI